VDENTRPNYSEIFEKQFPYYLSIGMTEAQYWDGDPTLTRAYHEAEQLRNIRTNEGAWLQGRYIYDALCAASPLFRMSSKRSVRANPYNEEPYPINKKQAEINEDEHEKKTMEKGKKFMELFMVGHNKQFAQKKAAEVKTDG